MQAIPIYRFFSAPAIVASLLARAGGRALLTLVRSCIYAFAGALGIAVAATPAAAQGHPELQANSRAALSSLEAQDPLAATLARRAVAVLVFPEVTKAGFLIGGEYGNGIMFRGGRFAGHYSTAGVTYGLQTKHMDPDIAQALVGAALLSLLVFPTLSRALLSRAQPAASPIQSG